MNLKQNETSEISFRFFPWAGCGGCLILLIPVTWEVEVGGLMIGGQPKQKVMENLSEK
jgi:hypothetical protein